MSRTPRQELTLLVKTQGRKVRNLAERLSSGADRIETFHRRAVVVVKAGHTKAAALGRNLAGDLDPSRPSDGVLADRVTKEQIPFLDGFAKDLAAGKYEERPSALRQRSELYGRRLVGTANESWAAAMQERRVVKTPILARSVLAVCEHCDSCEEDAALGWRPIDTIDRWPGDGSSTCGVRCRCKVETKSGHASFHDTFESPKRPSLAAKG